MSFDTKLSTIHTSKELKSFIRSIQFETTFIHGRKFSFEKNGEKISYNQLIDKIHQKVTYSKDWEGSKIVKELKVLDDKAENDFKLKSLVIRCYTYLKRFFSSLFFPRDQKLIEIQQSVSHDQSKVQNPSQQQVFLEKNLVEPCTNKGLNQIGSINIQNTNRMPSPQSRELDVRRPPIDLSLSI